GCRDRCGDAGPGGARARADRGRITVADGAGGGRTAHRLLPGAAVGGLSAGGSGGGPAGPAQPPQPGAADGLRYRGRRVGLRHGPGAHPPGGPGAGEPGRPADQHRAAYRLGTGAGGQLRCGGGRDRAVPAGEPSAGGPAAAASRQRRRGDGAARVQPAHRLYPYPGVPGRLESRFEPATDLARARDAGGRNRVAAAPRAGPVRARTARTDPYRTRPRTVAAPRGFTEATMTTQARSAVVLDGPTWRDRARRHATRADAMTAGWRRRKQTH